jgi:FKBP-type peptidyl-prolyl cis-trans isomerase SlpA
MTATHAIKIGDQVTLHYRLVCNGEEIAHTFPAEPETFCIGQGDIDPRLEALLLGLQEGDHPTFDLEAGAAFGGHDANLVHKLPRSEFAADAPLIPGHEAEFTLPNGQILHGIIRGIAENETTESDIEIDFNHPLAGLPVQFEVKILAIEPCPALSPSTPTQAD